MKRIVFSLVALICLLSFIPFSQPVDAAPSYTIDGNSVYSGNGDYFISVTPNTLTASGWVEVTLKSSSYNGQIDIISGFNGIDNVQSLKQEFYESYEHTTYINTEVTKTGTFTPNRVISINPQLKDISGYSYDSSLNSKVALIEVNDLSFTNTKKQVPFAYESYDGSKFTYKYKDIQTNTVKTSFEDWNKVDAKPVTVSKNYAGAQKWDTISSQRNIVAGNFYRVRVWIDIPFAGTAGISGKYNIGFKPSNLTLDQAIAQNKAWILDPWYNASWAYRKSITVTNASADYQTKVLIGKASGATGEEVDCGGYCQDDFDDLRFTGADGQTLLDYWVESVAVSGTSFLATVWVQNNATPDATLYMYYGNAGAASASSGANTFIKFDDFERGNNGDAVGGSWTVVQGSILISTDHAYSGTRAGKWVGGATIPKGTFAQNAATGTYAVRSRYWTEEAVAMCYVVQHGNATDQTLPYFVSATNDIMYYDTAARDTGSNGTNDQWELIELNDITFVGKTYDYWWNDVRVKDNAGMYAGGGVNNVLFYQMAETTAGRDMYLDDLIVRKWASTEPTFSAFGSLETDVPIISTVAADGIGATTANLKGSIDSLNSGSDCTIRGFEWDTDSGAPYANDVHEHGTFGVAAFNNNTQVFPSGTTIYYRAYATNPSGTGYGAESSFLTKPAAPTNVAATDGTDTAKVVITWTVPTGATHCDVYRDGADVSGWIAVPTATYDDATAAAPTITAGAATASDGTSDINVTLSIAGESANHGTTHTYKVIAKNATGNSADSATDTGYRDVGALTYQWQRSAADADAAYGNIGGATTDPYNDVAGVATPDGRYYKCVLDATGAVQQTTNADRGFMAAVPLMTTLKWSGIGKNWAILEGEVTDTFLTNVVEVGFEYGLTTAYGSVQTQAGVYIDGDRYWLAIRGLSPATVYHFRAAGRNTTGWGYGADMTFSTIGSPVLYEELNAGGDADGDESYANDWVGQSFTVGAVSHTATSVRVYIKRDGAPSTITLSLTHATANVPTGADLASQTIDGSAISAAYAWYEFTFTDAVNLQAGQQYAIVLRAIGGDAANSFYWYWDTAGGEPNGQAAHSVNGGISWHNEAGNDYLFEIWGNPALQVVDAKVVKDFITTGDWLIVAKVINTYEPYYSDYSDPSRYFRLEFLTAANVVKGTVPWVDYDKVPLGIYLSPTIASTMTWGDTTMKVRAYLSATEYFDYNLVAADWLPAITLLDSWVLVTAKDLEDYYSAVYLVKSGDKGMVLNEAGGTIFKRGIANLASIRPSLFQVAGSPVSAVSRTFTPTAITYNTQIGTYFTTQVNGFAGLFGVAGQEFLGFIILGIWLIISLVVMAKTSGIGGLIVASPILVLGYYIGGLDYRIVFGTVGVLAIMVIYKLFGQNAG